MALKDASSPALDLAGGGGEMRFHRVLRGGVGQPIGWFWVRAGGPSACNAERAISAQPAYRPRPRIDLLLNNSTTAKAVSILRLSAAAINCTISYSAGFQKPKANLGNALPRQRLYGPNLQSFRALPAGLPSIWVLRLSNGHRKNRSLISLIELRARFRRRPNCPSICCTPAVVLFSVIAFGTSFPGRNKYVLLGHRLSVILYYDCRIPGLLAEPTSKTTRKVLIAYFSSNLRAAQLRLRVQRQPHGQV